MATPSPLKLLLPCVFFALLSCAVSVRAFAETASPVPAFPSGRPLPPEDSPAWKKIVEPRREQVEKSVAAKTDLIAKMPAGTLTALDVPYVDHPIQSKFPGSTQTLDLYVPAGAGPFPLVIYIHGGAWNGGNKEIIGARLAAEWMPAGFAVASLGYRFGFDAPFPGMFQDCIDAVDFLREHAGEYHLNADKVGICGNSAGGHLAALVGMALGGHTYQRCEKPVQAVVVWCGYGDVTLETTGKPTGGFPYIYPHLTYDPDIARKISPVYQIHPGIPPVLVQHGEKDESVPLAQPTILVEKLKAGGYDATLITYPTYTHDLWKPDVRETALTFFKKHLQ